MRARRRRIAGQLSATRLPAPRARRQAPRGRCARPGPAPGGGSDGVACDHGKSTVHGLVHHEPPRLAESARRNRRHHQNIGGGVEVAQLPLGHRVQAHHRAAGRDPRGGGSRTDEDERGGWCLQARRTPSLHEHPQSLFPRGPSRKQEYHLDICRPSRIVRQTHIGRAPEVVVDRLRRDVYASGAMRRT